MFHLFAFGLCSLVYFPHMQRRGGLLSLFSFPGGSGSSFGSSINFEQVRRCWFRLRNVWNHVKHFLHTFFGSSFLAISSIDSDIFLLGILLVITFRSLIYVAFVAIVLQLHIRTSNYFNNLRKFPLRKYVRHLLHA